MTVISHEEFTKKWNDDVSVNGGRGYEFHLNKEQIVEWKENRKFDVVKEFCDSRNYEIFFCCMKGRYEEDRWFGFFFKNKDDSDKLMSLVFELKSIKTRDDVQNVKVLGREGIGIEVGNTCPHEGANCPFTV